MTKLTGSNQNQFHGSLSAFSWRTWGKARMASVWTGNQTWDLPNVKHECQPSNHDVRCRYYLRQGVTTYHALAMPNGMTLNPSLRKNSGVYNIGVLYWMWQWTLAF
jgi:hypothetical protein